MNEKGLPRFVKTITVVAILGLVALSGVSYVLYQQRQTEQDRAACIADVMYDLVEATNERTTYTGQLAERNVEQLKAFDALVDASLERPPPSEAEARRIVEDYDKALSDYLEVAERTSRTRQNFPYPTEQELAKCL